MDKINEAELVLGTVQSSIFSRIQSQTRRTKRIRSAAITPYPCGDSDGNEEALIVITVQRMRDSKSQFANAIPPDELQISLKSRHSINVNGTLGGVRYLNEYPLSQR